jgi:hypothetical protein
MHQMCTLMIDFSGFTAIGSKDDQAYTPRPAGQVEAPERERGSTISAELGNLTARPPVTARMDCVPFCVPP